MHRYIITGFSGFVSKNFIEYLNENKIQTCVLGVDVHNPSFETKCFECLNIKFEKSDLRDKDRIGKMIYDFKPDYILHLASYSSVAGSWKSPNSSFQNNVNIFVNLLEGIRMAGVNCRIISVGSSEEYGAVNVTDLPLTENQKLNPSSPFGIARFSQEMIAKLYSDVYGLDIMMTRSFNHIGPGQKDNYAVSSFAKQLVEIKMNKLGEFVVAGDVNIVRDFVDVRDVVHAYHLLFLRGKKGEIYNICSGYGISLHNIIQMMCEILEVNIMIKEDKKLRRPKDNPVIIGSNEKIKRELNWCNEIPLEDSLRSVIKYYMDDKILSDAR
ncbi:MAG: GDP-mannose 4,6-dehydratase [bacterium]|nr:GDP-mannose 4,6-dehydratase [bacterium]